MRYLAIDLGDKRTGLAVGDDLTRIVTPLEVIAAPIEPADRLVARIERAVDELGVDAIVMGLPLNMDGTEGERANKSRAFGALLGARLGLPIYFEDERLSSAAADWSLAGSGLTRGQKKNRRDALAAAEILRTFLAGLGEADPG